MQKHIWHRKLQTKGTVIGLFKIKQTYELDNKYKALSLKFKKKTKGKGKYTAIQQLELVGPYIAQQ